MPLPPGVSYVVQQSHHGAPTRILITIESRHFATIENALAQVLDELVVTSVRRSVALIRQNTTLSRQLRELIEASGDHVQIPMQLQRHLPRGNRVFAVTILSESIEFRGGNIPYAYNTGFWHIVFGEPPQRQDPQIGVFMDVTAQVERQRVIEAYNHGYTDGTNCRDRILDQVIWHRMHQSPQRFAAGIP